MLEVIRILEHDWKVKVIAFTTDASGEARKARRLLRKKMPRLVTPDCWAHQVSNYTILNIFTDILTYILRG